MSNNIDYDNLVHHPFSESIVEAISSKIGKKDKPFFRIHLAYYLATVASSMRVKFKMPNSKIPQLVSLFGINLAPSGFGKGFSTQIIEEQVLEAFKETFTKVSLPLLAEINIAKLAHERSLEKTTDPDIELEKTLNDYARLGVYTYFASAGTQPAVKQVCDKLLMAKAGSINISIDEIGFNLLSNKDLLILLLELYDGKTKPKLIKNTTESIRSETLSGLVPTNLMLFGVPNTLLDGGKNEDEFLSLLFSGYARRCFFGFVPENYSEKLELLSPEKQLELAKKGEPDVILDKVSTAIEKLSDISHVDRVLVVPDETALLFFEYENYCKTRAHELEEYEILPRVELQHRAYKTMRLAAIYAFIDTSAEITPLHFKAAIKIAEDSGKAFESILTRDRPYVRLAKYLGAKSKEVTQADLVEDLPFYRGSVSAKNEMLIQAGAWGYQNNILIKRRYQDTIEFISGEMLEPTNLNEIIISYSNQITEGYNNDIAPFIELTKLTQLPNFHWVNHHVKDSYRSDEHCIPGFNIIVFDVDTDISFRMAKSLLKGYKALLYTTKRHTQQNNRFRIIIPTNYKLKLEADIFKEFMQNVFEWLPFNSDTQTGQRSRKWLTYNGYSEYIDGKLLDVLPFIPKTVKNEDFKQRLIDLSQLGNIERWVVQHAENGNRNNQLIRYALILVDGGYSYNQILSSVLELNEKFNDSLPESEILSTIMVTVNKKLNN